MYQMYLMVNNGKKFMALTESRTNYDTKGFKCIYKDYNSREYINDSKETKSFYWYDLNGDKEIINIAPNQKFEVLLPSPENYGRLRVY